MHSSRRHKGKLTERWGRKASGLRAWAPRTAGLPTETLNDTVAKGHAPLRIGPAAVFRFPSNSEDRGALSPQNLIGPYAIDNVGRDKIAQL